MSCRRLKEINGLVVHGRVSMRTVNHSVAHLGTNIEIFDQDYTWVWNIHCSGWLANKDFVLA